MQVREWFPARKCTVSPVPCSHPTTSCVRVGSPFTHCFRYLSTLGSNNTETWAGRSMRHSFHKFPTGPSHGCPPCVWCQPPWKRGRGCDLGAAALGTVQAAGGGKPRTQHLAQAGRRAGPGDEVVNAPNEARRHSHLWAKAGSGGSQRSRTWFRERDGSSALQIQSWAGIGVGQWMGASESGDARTQQLALTWGTSQELLAQRRTD